MCVKLRMWVILHIFAASVIVRMLHREYSKGAKLLIFFKRIVSKELGKIKKL